MKTDDLILEITPGYHGDMPEGLRYSERKVWDECPACREALARLARTRKRRLAPRWKRVLFRVVSVSAAVFFAGPLILGILENDLQRTIVNIPIVALFIWAAWIGYPDRPTA